MADIGANIGDALKKSVAESFKNLDPVALMQKIVAENPEDEASEEIREKLQGVLQKYGEMSDTDKQAFVAQMREMLVSKISMKLKDTNINLDGLQEAIGEAIVHKLVLVGAGLLIIFILLVFFGYKLYKSIKEKELKKEEKKKAKQMKKKK